MRPTAKERMVADLNRELAHEGQLLSDLLKTISDTEIRLLQLREQYADKLHEYNERKAIVDGWEADDESR